MSSSSSSPDVFVDVIRRALRQEPPDVLLNCAIIYWNQQPTKTVAMLMEIWESLHSKHVMPWTKQQYNQSVYSGLDSDKHEKSVSATAQLILPDDVKMLVKNILGSLLESEVVAGDDKPTESPVSNDIAYSDGTSDSDGADPLGDILQDTGKSDEVDAIGDALEHILRSSTLHIGSPVTMAPSSSSSEDDIDFASLI